MIFKDLHKTCFVQNCILWKNERMHQLRSNSGIITNRRSEISLSIWISIAIFMLRSYLNNWVQCPQSANKCLFWRLDSYSHWHMSVFVDKRGHLGDKRRINALSDRINYYISVVSYNPNLINLCISRSKTTKSIIIPISVTEILYIKRSVSSICAGLFFPL
jgi:hypothetical protein